MGRSRTYPRSHDRGPIEALNVLRGIANALTNYPRSHDRGPIEANRFEASRVCGRNDAIRGHMTAAPLKLGG